MASQVVKRISIRWLPEPAFEDTDTIALNVGGYFIDLRVEKETQAIQWSRAGERILLKDDPRELLPSSQYLESRLTCSMKLRIDGHISLIPSTSRYQMRHTSTSYRMEMT